MAKTRWVKRITAGRHVEEVAYDRILPTDGPRARQAKRRHSTLARSYMNYKKSWKQLQLLLLCNFSPGDYFGCLTYRDDALPARAEDGQKEAAKYFSRLKRQADRLGAELKYIYNTETLNKDGSKRIHHHFIVSADGGKLPAETIQSLWRHGEVEVGLLGEDPQYSDDMIEIAQYLTKERFPDSPDRKPGKRGYNGSKNLERPKEECFAIEDTMTIAAPPGAKIIDQDHKDNEYGRFDYLVYELPRLPQRAGPPGGRKRKLKN